MILKQNKTKIYLLNERESLPDLELHQVCGRAESARCRLPGWPWSTTRPWREPQPLSG